MLDVPRLRRELARGATRLGRAEPGDPRVVRSALPRGRHVHDGAVPPPHRRVPEGPAAAPPLTLRDLPALNASLNATSALLLLLGYVLIRAGRREAHRRA